ncbi:hypothetical protein [Paracoccus sp. (in: a-proteobacteria)]|uniref:hypothetical protein n=1 Tax=Paracoccus sp. TaxID=267 RepID=UPI0026DF20F1|nr:hypothetical protein [Paracoccus sp. (in: a-proteobacteria)]MDO5647152.1 hypothetical protein [Paracoccus sp. (in: a-proteobacteria)]
MRGLRRLAGCSYRGVWRFFGRALPYTWPDVLPRRVFRVPQVAASVDRVGGHLLWNWGAF